MKKYGLSLAVIFVFLWTATGYAMVQLEVLSPTTCIRGTGAPVTEVFTFPGFSGPATVKLTNGGLEDDSVEKNSSSIVTVNGQVVFSSSDFNQNVSYLEKEVALLEGQNSLEILLKGKPGGQVTIQIVQEAEAEAAALIGSEGGVIEVADPHSPLLGVGVHIPEGTFAGEALVTISVQDNSPSKPLPQGVVQEGPCISFESSDHDFQGPVYINIPFEGERQEDETRLVYTYNESREEWEMVVPLPTSDPAVFVAMVEHFSDYVKGEATMTDTDIEASFEIGRDTLRYTNNGFEVNGFPPCQYNDPVNSGVCAGLGLVATEYFNEWANKEGEGLMCRWDTTTAAKASCEAFGIYIDRTGRTASEFFASMWEVLVEVPLLGIFYLDYSYIVDAVKFNATQNIVTIVGMFRDIEDPNNPNKTKTVGHAVVAYGWRKTGWFSGEIKIYNLPKWRISTRGIRVGRGSLSILLSRV